MYQRERAGRLGLVAYVVNLLGLAGLFGVEFASHAVLQFLDPPTRDEILAGPTRGYFLAVAAVFLAGVVAFSVASWRARMLPTGGILCYLVGFAPASLRGIVPEAVYLGGLIVGGLGVAWLSLALLRAFTARPTTA